MIETNDGVQTFTSGSVYTFTDVRVDAIQDLEVYYKATATSVPSLLTEGAGNDYTVTNLSVDSGVKVTRVAGAISPPEEIILRRYPVAEQQVKLRNQRGYVPEAVEYSGLDLLTMSVQAAREELARAPKLDIGSSDTPGRLELYLLGPGSGVTDDRLALFDGTTGNLIKEGSVTGTEVAAFDTRLDVIEADYVTSPGVQVAGRVAIFSADGVIDDSAVTDAELVAYDTRLDVIEADYVTSPGAQVANRLAIFSADGVVTDNVTSAVLLVADVTVGNGGATARIASNVSGGSDPFIDFSDVTTGEITLGGATQVIVGDGTAALVKIQASVAGGGDQPYIQFSDVTDGEIVLKANEVYIGFDDLTSNLILQVSGENTAIIGGDDIISLQATVIKVGKGGASARISCDVTGSDDPYIDFTDSVTGEITVGATQLLVGTGSTAASNLIFNVSGTNSALVAGNGTLDIQAGALTHGSVPIATKPNRSYVVKTIDQTGITFGSAVDVSDMTGLSFPGGADGTRKYKVTATLTLDEINLVYFFWGASGDVTDPDFLSFRPAGQAASVSEDETFEFSMEIQPGSLDLFGIGVATFSGGSGEVWSEGPLACHLEMVEIIEI